MKKVNYVLLNGKKRKINLTLRGAKLDLRPLHISSRKETIRAEELQAKGVLPELLVGGYDLDKLNVFYVYQVVRNFSY